ncbi:hypothetical protein [Corynebacterium sp. AOP12-C2-36]|uniref:hypothetical protein n=1 Tax=Corynebacterium sp. AOP12-C2-36 TaxID=3457723 RepID=UPI004033E6C0
MSAKRTLTTPELSRLLGINVKTLHRALDENAAVMVGGKPVHPIQVRTWCGWPTQTVLDALGLPDLPDGVVRSRSRRNPASANADADTAA